jgi:tetratricopeptide (TPR) repeat protein
VECPQAFFRIAQGFAREKNIGAVYFAGSRAVQAAEASSGVTRSLKYLLRPGDLCDQAGNTKLALTILDDVEKVIERSGSDLVIASRKWVLAAVQRRRIKWLSVIFESLTSAEKSGELWNLAKSQAGYAISRGDHKVMAQCFSWMSVAAILMDKYELGREQAEDAILFARQSRDRFRVGFSHLYLGHAYRGLGNIQEAAVNYAKAIQTLPKRKFGRIHTVAMLSMAQASEQLGMLEPALRLYRSAHELAQGAGQTDLEADAIQGVNGLSG